MSADESRPKHDKPQLIDCGEMGILFADLSGYTGIVYQCAADAAAMQRMAMAMYKLFNESTAQYPDVRIEGYAGDGFLALSGGKTPVRTLYLFAEALHRRFRDQVRSLLMDLGFRTSPFLRTGLHVGRVYRLRLTGATDSHDSVCISDAINLASRVITGQVARRTGLAVTRDCYRRLLRAGGKEIREPDEVIQDRNKYPEPVLIYRLLAEERQAIMEC